MHVPIIAEIGINHNGEMSLAKELIRIASVSGCNFVKFQKRNPDICVPEEKKNEMKVVPWENEPITYLQYKKDIEFNIEQYKELFDYAKELGLTPFASVWDIESAKEMSTLTHICKIPSAKINDLELLEYCHLNFQFSMMSTGMSTEPEIEIAVFILDPDVIFHTNSEYPSPIEDLNLLYIKHLKRKFGSYTPMEDLTFTPIEFLQRRKNTRYIGYSNHFYGLTPCFASVALGAEFIEVHITKDHRMWGSDHSSSVEPTGLFKLVKGIRDLEEALKGDQLRTLYPGEIKKLKSLRKTL